MPKRGSVQLLLLSLRPRARLGLGIGAAVVIFLLAGWVQVGQEVTRLTKTGLVQALRQSAWDYALAGQSQPQHWPWEDDTANMSYVPGTKVPRLGLSAVILQDTGEDAVPLEPRPIASVRGHKASQLGDVALSDVDIGDSITVTAADGASRNYTVTGRRVVDPHLADIDPGPAENGGAFVTCWPLDPLMASSLRLIIQATQDEPRAAPQPVHDQQKL